METNTRFQTAVTTQDTSDLSSTQVHIFEYAGLGKAPFTYLGAEDKKGTCQFCGKALATLFHVLSADGRQFHVGCDCVEKTGDENLTSEVKQAKKLIASDRKFAKLQAAISTAESMFTTRKKEFAKMSHPAIPGKTFADYIQWRLDNWCNPDETIRKMEAVK